MALTRGERTRAAVIRHAARLFRAKGYRCASISAILTATAISKGAFYYHFKSKRELGSAAVEYYRARMSASILRAFENGAWKTAPDRMPAVFANRPQSPLYHGLPLARLGIEFAGTETALLDEVACAMHAGENLVARKLEQSGLPPKESHTRAGSIFAYACGHAWRLLITNDLCCSARLESDVALIGRLLKALPASSSNAPSSLPPHLEAKAMIKAIEIAEKRLDIVDARSIIQFVGKSQDSYFDNRRRILTAAAVRFWQRGYKGAGVSGILSQCGIPKGSFHYYFESKKGLALDVFGAYERFYRSLLSDVFAAESWQEAVAIFCGVLKIFAEKRIVFVPPLVGLGMELVGTEPDLARKLSGILSGAEKSFRRAFDNFFPGTNHSDRLAASAVALWKGHLTRLAIYRDDGVLKQLQADLFALGECSQMSC